MFERAFSTVRACTEPTMLRARYNLMSRAMWLQEGQKVVWGLTEMLQAASQGQTDSIQPPRPSGK